ncbi:DUF4350 domain-containing protein [Leifsonia sp. 21MFCrub1.1]|uniref:DUF4350 domain-containing protein n=1 Tax=Leifsonia sp. 21MFCrub1.1 TaxID=1798223 RepID=UPI0008928A2C|nr:DUF4350 domain-containing protein [Leifsonia sp. 21MFCrub1.1]SEB00015.1 protein of unknown function [Leifsonia sp. 21MFCrub1.1]
MSAPAPVRGSDTRSEARPGPAVPTAQTPTVRQTARRAVPWIVLALIAVVIALGGSLLTGGRVGPGTTLDATNAAPTGAKAVAQVLRGQGVDVRTVSTIDRATAAAADGATVLVYDPLGNLTSDGYRALTGDGRTLVVVEPDFETLQTLDRDVTAAGAPRGTASAGCTVPAAERAERIDPRATPATEDVAVPGTFRVSDDAATCFADAGGRASLVRTSFNASPVYLLGSAAVLTNDGVDRLGNAALALNLLGGHRTLVWYLPSLDDRPVSGPPDIAQLTPGWVTPVMLLLVAVFVAAAIWRGRRFGPLVVENLPVIVRAGETREGRARLYQRSSARLRAADALRVGTIGRLSALAGLPTTATVAEVGDAVAALTRRDRLAVREVLVERIPQTDRDLVALSDDLAELERATASAVSPSAGPDRKNG